MNHDARNNPWPNSHGEQKTPKTTAIVTVNYNTCPLTIQLIWSIYHNLKAGGFATLLVVDNNSSDGSQQYLRSLAREHLIEYIENKENLYHGPALNQTFDYLSKMQREDGIDNIGAIWVLDSDCVVIHPRTLVNATEAMNQTHAALVGQKAVDRWNEGTFGLHSLLIDPAQVWRDPISPFEEYGQPSLYLQESCMKAGLTLSPFNFTSEDYVIHLGRSTLAAVVKKHQTDNRHRDFYSALPNFDIDSVVADIKGAIAND